MENFVPGCGKQIKYQQVYIEEWIKDNVSANGQQLNIFCATSSTEKKKQSKVVWITYSHF